MARTVRDARLDSRAARAKLAPRGKPYWRAIDPGLHLGYRKPTQGAGKWVARFYEGSQSYATETLAIGDDLSEANGVDVLNFSQAQAAARKRRDTRARATAGKGPLTVAAAIERYLAALEAKGRGPPRRHPDPRRANDLARLGLSRGCRPDDRAVAQMVHRPCDNTAAGAHDERAAAALSARRQ